MSKESEYFARLMLGKEEPIQDGVHKNMYNHFKDMVLFLMLNHYVMENHDDPKGYKKHLLELWEQKVEEKFKAELKEHEEMANTTAGQIFGGMVSPEELEAQWEREFNETKKTLMKILQLNDETNWNDS